MKNEKPHKNIREFNVGDKAGGEREVDFYLNNKHIALGMEYFVRNNEFLELYRLNTNLLNAIFPEHFPVVFWNSRDKSKSLLRRVIPDADQNEEKLNTAKNEFYKKFNTFFKIPFDEAFDTCSKRNFILVNDYAVYVDKLYIPEIFLLVEKDVFERFIENEKDIVKKNYLRISYNNVCELSRKWLIRWNRI